MAKQRVIAYIDGFNLFYGSLKGTHYKWLDIYSLCKTFLKPNQELIAVKYFSARVGAFGEQIDRPEKQKIYLQALATFPKVEIILGYFSAHKVKMPSAKEYEQGKIVPVEVIKTEEKGTDVNLAVQMVADAYENRFDYAMLFSNDSDIAYSVKISTKVCKKYVGLYIDKKASPTKVLQENICYIKRLSPSLLAEHQLPEKLTSPTGRLITKPKDW
ncbi:MAG: NYN domain-containing protein [Synergistaceae bacterium]|nr:NYN domain-containing protein [Synergistaceae bacterium]